MKNFNKIYEEVYKKSFQTVEEKRKRANQRIVNAFWICTSIGIIVSIIVWNIIPIFLGLLIAIILGSSSKENNEYQINYKELVIRNLIREYNQKWIFNPYRGISSHVYSLGEFERFDRFKSEDYIGGVLNNRCIIDMAEVTTEDRHTDEDGNTSYSIIFQGLFARISFATKIDSITKVRKNKFKLIESRNTLEMDSGEFERIFDVYSEGKVTTMQILTLETMQKIIDFTHKTKIIPEFTIKQNYLYIRFKIDNVFEPSLTKNSLDYETLKKYFDVINFVELISKEILNNIEQ